MRWDCPHCGTALVVHDEKMNMTRPTQAGRESNDRWSFSRCHQCGGYALVRKSEISTIAVERAPAGQQVLETEPPEVSAGQRDKIKMSEDMSHVLSQAVIVENKPVIRPAVPRRQIPQIEVDRLTHTTEIPPEVIASLGEIPDPTNLLKP